MKKFDKNVTKPKFVKYEKNSFHAVFIQKSHNLSLLLEQIKLLKIYNIIINMLRGKKPELLMIMLFHH